MEYFKTRHLLLAVLLAMAASTGCHKIDNVERGSVKRNRIDVRLYAEATKGSVMTTSTLEEAGNFVMEAYVDGDYCDYENDPNGENPFAAGKYIARKAGGNVFYGSGIWSITPETYWVSDVNTTFWCWSPSAVSDNPAVKTTFTVDDYAAPFNSDKLNFTYARPGSCEYPLLNADGTTKKNSECTDADDQEDILLAYAKKKYTADTDEFVTLVFYHPLSQIRFAVSPNDGTFDATLKIAQIAIKNIKQGGQCTFNGTASTAEDKFTWNLGDAATTSYAQSYEAGFQTCPDNWRNEPFTVSNKTYDKYITENVFFVTPQTLTNETKLDILFEDNGKYIEVEKTLPTVDKDTWLPGHYYTYKIEATVLGRTIKVNVSLDDWKNYDDKLFI